MKTSSCDTGVRPIRLADDNNDLDELRQLSEWIAQGKQLTMGPLVYEFEKKAEEVFKGHATLVSSGSAALMLAVYSLMQLDRLRNNTIVVPAISWATTVSPAIQFGLQPILCDCDNNSLSLDIDQFETLCRKYRPAAAIVVHVLGHAANMAELLFLCERYGVLLIEDCCESMGTVIDGRPVGSFGALSCFSMYYGHQLSSIEGGIIVTKDGELNDVVRSLRAHGWARDIDPGTRHTWEGQFNIDEFQSYYTFYHPGFNCRPNELNAFLALSQLRNLDKVIDRRQHIFELYKQRLGVDYWAQSSCSEKVSSFAYGTLVENRLDVFKTLRDNFIESRPIIAGNVGRQPFWVKRFGETRLKNADIVHDHGIYLPIHSNLKDEDVCYVTKVFSQAATPKYFV